MRRLDFASLDSVEKSPGISSLTDVVDPTVGTSPIIALQLHVGISPAIAGMVKTHVNVIVASIRFIEVAPC